MGPVSEMVRNTMTLYEKVESTDDYPRWKAVYDAWVDDPTIAINLRDMAGEYFDDFMVAVEPTDRICIIHHCLSGEYHALNDDHSKEKNWQLDCVVVDVVRVTP